MSGADRQRIDKWLWFARVVKTRPLAQELAESGQVRLNGRKVDASAQAVKAGDVLTIGLRGQVRILKILAFAERRGGAPEAALLYEDLSPAPPPADPVEQAVASGGLPETEPGSGRPTKRDRRRRDRLIAD